MGPTEKTIVLLTACLIALGASAQNSSTKTPEQPPVLQEETEPPYDTVVPAGRIVTPQSSISRPGKAVHTNLKIFVPAGQQNLFTSDADTVHGETPASMACVYGIGTKYTGCNPANGTASNNAVGGWGAIALVAAYDDPKAAVDLATFSKKFGLPAAAFAVHVANSSYGTLNGLTASCSGTPPAASASGWDLEESVDIEWAHAMAPSAYIELIEACSDSLPDLLYAEEVAGIYLAKHGGGDISNSWGYPENEVGVSGDGGGTLTQQQDDNFFFRYYWSNVTYFASAGDSGSEVLFPSTSPWVVSAGGTTVNRDSKGNYLSESCWADSGGGASAVETWATTPSIADGMGPWTTYQYELFGQSARRTPDMSFNADPASGVLVYDSNESSGGGWYIVAGTSVSSPALAGIVNNAHNKLSMATSSTGGYYQASELNLIYSQLNAFTAYPANFYDVKTGSNGNAAGTGYDQCTGVGSPRGLKGK